MQPEFCLQQVSPLWEQEETRSEGGGSVLWVWASLGITPPKNRAMSCLPYTLLGLDSRGP